MPDTDLDGVSDGGELAAGTGPLLRDSDGDGLVDGSDPDPLSATSLDDLDGDGIPDAYETAMFGSTNVVNDLDHDPNGTGFPLSTKIAAGMDPAAMPAEATIPLDNLESLKLFDGFRCDFTNAPRVVYSRVIDIDRDNGWQQYFLSSAPDKAGARKPHGMVLEWEDSEGGSVTRDPSPRDDTFHSRLHQQRRELTSRSAPPRRIRSPSRCICSPGRRASSHRRSRAGMVKP